jgi:D-proline reductase (dithiol) PrdB
VHKIVDSYRFLDGVAKRTMQRWSAMRDGRTIPWTPLTKPLSQCTVSMVSSAALALKTDLPFDLEIERRDPWFADPSYRVLPGGLKTGDAVPYHLHINTRFAQEDINSVLPLERLIELAELGEIGASAPSHYSYSGYTLRPAALLRDSVPCMVRQLREQSVDIVILVPV